MRTLKEKKKIRTRGPGQNGPGLRSPAFPNLMTHMMIIRKIDKLLLEFKEEKELFQKICDLLLKMKCIKFAWIGLVHKSSFEIVPEGFSGQGPGSTKLIQELFGDPEDQYGPLGTALKTRQVIMIRDMDLNKKFLPWKESCLKQGYQSSVCLPIIHSHDVIGILSAYSGMKDPFREMDIKFLNEVSNDIALSIKSTRLNLQLAQSLDKYEKIMSETVNAITFMGKVRDPYTAGHEERVTKLACAIANEMMLPKWQIRGLHTAGLLHDTGKIAIPSEILSKPGKISEYEFNLIKTHPQVSYDILKGIEFPWPVARIVLQHHERMNGSGYPSGLNKDDILIEAKILSVADVVEAMSSHRPYRPAFTIEKALEEIKMNSGILYDNTVVEACLMVFKEKGFKWD